MRDKNADAPPYSAPARPVPSVGDRSIRRLRRSGATLATSEPVTEFLPHPGGGFRVVTPSRTVTAPKVVLTTGGKSYELHQISSLAADLKAQPVTELNTIKKDLWNQWLTLIAVLSLLMVEWIVRKLVNMR